MARKRQIERLCELMQEMVEQKQYDKGLDVISELMPEDLDSVLDLRNMATIQENTGHIEDMKRTYLCLFNMTGARHNLIEFIKVLIRIGEIADAKVYLKEFEKMDGAVADDFDLRYAISKATDSSIEDRIRLLEDFKKEEYMEVWGKRLADLYKQAGRMDDYKNEMADLHLWFGGARILPEEDETEDEEAKQVVAETSENLAARMEAESEIENAINEHVGEEVSRIVEESTQTNDVPSEPTLDDMLSATAKTRIERLEVEPTSPIGQLDPDTPVYEAAEPSYHEEPVYQTAEPSYSEEPVYEAAEPSYSEESAYAEEPSYEAAEPVIESVGKPHTASGEEVDPLGHTTLEAKYLNRRGQAETVGEPVKTDDPIKAQRLEKMFTVDENYEEGPADVSERGIRYFTTSDVVAKLRRRDFEPPHFVFAGGEEKITLTMTKRISKELSRLGYTSAQKVMRITAERMNTIRLEDQIDRLIGRSLLITEAAELSRESVEQLLKVLHEFGEEFVVMLSGPFDEIDCFLQIYPELEKELPYKVRMVY